MKLFSSKNGLHGKSNENAYVNSEAPENDSLDTPEIDQYVERSKVFPNPSTEVGETFAITSEILTKVQLNIERSPIHIAHLHAVMEHQISVLLDNASVRHSILENESPSIIGVTSAIKGEGKSTVALHLAMSVARDSFKKVCLIDLSLDDDNMARRLGLRNSDGIIQVLEGSSYKLPTMEIEGYDNLAIIPAGGGRQPLNPAKVARSPHVVEIIAAARQMFDLVIVDLPAISSGNALPLARNFDAVVMVVNAGVTPKQIVNDALDYIGRQRTLGIVLNRVKPSMPGWLHRRLTRVG